MTNKTKRTHKQRKMNYVKYVNELKQATKNCRRINYQITQANKQYERTWDNYDKICATVIDHVTIDYSRHYNICRLLDQLTAQQVEFADKLDKMIAKRKEQFYKSQKSKIILIQRCFRSMLNKRTLELKEQVKPLKKTILSESVCNKKRVIVQKPQKLHNNTTQKVTLNNKIINTVTDNRKEGKPTQHLLKESRTPVSSVIGGALTVLIAIFLIGRFVESIQYINWTTVIHIIAMFTSFYIVAYVLLLVLLKCISGVCCLTLWNKEIVKILEDAEKEQDPVITEKYKKKLKKKFDKMCKDGTAHDLSLEEKQRILRILMNSPNLILTPMQY
jgi:hypothetical protein